MKKILVILISVLLFGSPMISEAKSSKATTKTKQRSSSTSVTINPSLLLYKEDGMPAIRTDVLTNLSLNDWKCTKTEYVDWDDLCTDGTIVMAEEVTFTKKGVTIKVLHAIEEGYESNYTIDLTFPSSADARQFVSKVRNSYGIKYTLDGLYVSHPDYYGLCMSRDKNKVSLFYMI